MYVHEMKSICRVLAVAAVALLPVALMAQDSTRPAAKASTDNSASKWDIFVGYSYLAPNAKITGTQTGAPGSTYGQINFGGIMSVTRFFNKNLGVQIEGDEHIQSEDYPAGSNNSIFNSNDDFAGGSAGLIYRIPKGNFTPFVHALFGMEQVGSIYRLDTWGAVGTAGGGLDFNTPLFNHRLAIRLFQADYQYINADSTSINAMRVSTGAVYHIGNIAPPPPLTAACSASTASVFPGEPIAMGAAVGQLNPKLSVVYSWTGPGVTGRGVTAAVDTSALAPGTYTATATVKQGKAGKEGLKPGDTAQCSNTFTVKAFEPPTISCSALPSTIKPGELANIKATGLSPQSRPLKYSFTTSAGSVNGMGAEATFNSNGAPTGAVGILCSVSDDKGQMATANTTVTIVAPYIPPAPHTQALCSVSFAKDKKRPTRVDNEAKACLDDVTLSLQKSPDAKAVVVGESTADEKAQQARAERLEARKIHPQPVPDPAAARAVNTKEYLVLEKGIDASRVTVATSAADGQKVEDYLVPAGASFSADVQGASAINETAVRPQARKPLAAKKHAKKAVKKAAE
jgi:hypothetical protein